MYKLAHRGYSEYYPENTLLAFKESLKFAFDGIETDVQMTRDGQLVLIHDEKINRTSNGKGYVKDYTYKELLAYNFSNGFDERESIPKLSELLELLKTTDRVLNIELKTNKFAYEGIEEKVYKMVNDYGMQDRIYYSSASLESMKIMKGIDSSVYCAIIVGNHLSRAIDQAIEYHLDGIHMDYRCFEQKAIERIMEKKIQIGVWTIKKEKEYQSLLKYPLFCMFSNKYFE